MRLGEKERIGLNMFIGTEIPIGQEKVLQVVYARPFDAQVGITPEKFIGVTAIIDVLIAYVDASYKSYLAIHYDNLPVIAVIEAIGQGDKNDLVKGKYGNTSRPQAAHHFL